MSNTVVSAVIEMLADKNPNAATRFTQQYRDKSKGEQEAIVDLNRFWRDQLMALPVSTISARTCLVDEMAPQDWLRHFNRLVLPVIVANNLPK